MMTKQAVADEPLPSLENGNDTDDKSSIWASILRDVKSSTKKAPATKSLVVLGDNESGRTTLIAKLQGNDDPKRGAGLEYHYIDVKDDDQDDTPKLGVWILDGDVACSAPLLKFAIKPETLENTIIILVASMTQPWSLLSTLKKWITLIEEHIDRLKIDPTYLRELRDHLQYDFQHYIEPNDSSVMLTSSTSSTTIKSGVGGGRVPSSVSSASIASTTPLSPQNGEEQVVLPLADGVLTKSLGIQVIVVITKCDTMSILEKENDYKDESFDFMQHHLRKFCLEYGAALFYTSVKEKKNIDKLYKYIIHKCYGYPFTSSAAIVERDAIFIPAGWDNPKKVDILLENIHRFKSTDNYSDVFVKPIVRRPLQRDNEIITAEDDQEFLSRLQLTIHRPVSPVRADENGTPGPARNSIGGGSQTPSLAARQPKPQNVPASDPNRTTNEGALANFFNSLLTRKSGGAVTPTTAGTPTTQRQTSQSPTTPSSKRLQQHPLTFAVTPPPGRTKTPTSLKTFPSPLNVDSSPKILSPVVEQQPKIETTSPSNLPATVRTPIEDSEPVTNLNGIEDKQSNDVLQLENEPSLNVDQQNIEPITSQHDSISNTINNSNNETLDSPSRSSSLIEDKSNVVQTALTHDSDRRLSNDFSLSSSSQPDEHSNTEHQEISSSKNQSRSTSPVVNDNNKQLDRSPSIDHKSPRLLSSPTLENAQQLNDKEENENRTFPIVSQEETPTSPHQDISLNNNSDEQQDTSKQSPNSSRRNSAINSSIPSRPLSPVSNEPQQQEAVPDENSLTNESLRLLSTSNVNTSEEEQQDQTLITLSNTNNTQNYLHSPVEMSDDNPSLHSTENINSSPATENHNSLKSANIDHHPSSLTNCQPDNPIFIEDNLQKSPINETVLSPFLIPQNSEPTKLIGSPTLESGDTKFNSYENTTAPSITEEKNIRSRSPSPTIKQEQERSRTSSPIIKQEQERSRSPSPINEQKQQRSRSPSSTIKQEQERSRSPSPITEQKLEESESPLHLDDHKQQRSRSPSPTLKQEQDRSRSPSPVTEQKLEESKSPLHLNEQKQQRSRSPSPTLKQEQERSRSPSPITEQKLEESESPLHLDDHKQQRSRSPSPTLKQEQARSRSPSPITEQKLEQSESSLHLDDHKQQRSRSPSPTLKQEQDRSRSPSPITEQGREKSRSPSPAIEQNEERSQSPSPAIEQNEERSQSPSPAIEQNEERSQSPSPAIEQNEERSQSPSPAIEQNEERSQSPSPNNDHNEQISPSSSSNVDQNSQNNQSTSVTIEQKQERSRSPSPSAEQNHQKSRSPSPVIEQKEQRSRSPSLSIEQNQERNRPSSPSAEQKEERSRSPSPISQLEQQPNRSTSPINEQKQQRSRSPSPITEHKEQRSRSPSPNIDQKIERKRSSSSIHEDQRKDSFPVEPLENKSNILTSPKFEENKSPRLSKDVNYDTIDNLEENVATSPMIEPKQEDHNRSPSPTNSEKHNQDHENIRTSSTPVTDKNEQLKKSPLSSPLTENHSSQALKSPVNENVSSSILEKQGTTSHISTINPKQRNLSHSSTKHSSVDHHHEHNASPISIPPVGNQPGITRSQSQSTIARPNTLPFSPNNHDLDGLYTSNDYNDEDEIPYDSEYHHNSAPSTVSVEYRRSSLLHNSSIDQQHTPVDPNDISKRLSIVEKSRMEDNDNNDIDSTTNSKDT